MEQSANWSNNQQDFFFGFVCFSSPTSPPRSFIGLVQCPIQCVPAYTFKKLVFKGVTRGMDNQEDFKSNKNTN